jgi:hypothetical protein
MADILPYLMAIIGFLIVHVISGIKGEIKEVKTAVSGLEKDLRTIINSIDNRVSILEAMYMRDDYKHDTKS